MFTIIVEELLLSKVHHCEQLCYTKPRGELVVGGCFKAHGYYRSVITTQLEPEVSKALPHSFVLGSNCEALFCLAS